MLATLRSLSLVNSLDARSVSSCKNCKRQSLEESEVFATPFNNDYSPGRIVDTPKPTDAHWTLLQPFSSVSSRPLMLRQDNGSESCCTSKFRSFIPPLLPPSHVLTMTDILNHLYRNVLNVDLMCTFDLFPVPEAAYEVRSPGSTSSPEPSYATASYHASHLPASGSSIHQHSQSRYPPTYLLHPYMNVEADGSPSTKQPLQALPTSGHLCQSETPHDVVHRVGNHLITESSKLIAPLIGEKFVEPTLIEYEGRKALAFVFGVSTQFPFTLRRVLRRGACRGFHDPCHRRWR